MNNYERYLKSGTHLSYPEWSKHLQEDDRPSTVPAPYDWATDYDVICDFIRVNLPRL